MNGDVYSSRSWYTQGVSLVLYQKYGLHDVKSFSNMNDVGFVESGTMDEIDFKIWCSSNSIILKLIFHNIPSTKYGFCPM